MTTPLPDAPIIVSLADDLTGANITAALLREAGLAPVHMLRTSDREPHVPAAAAALVVDVGSRDVDEAAALQRLAMSVSQLRSQITGRAIAWNKRIDSTLRGHITAELRFLTTTLAPAGTIVAPAFPTAGRHTVEGRLALAGDAEIGAANDRSILELVEQAGLTPSLAGPETHPSICAGESCRDETAAGGFVPAAGAAVVVDASTEEHLIELAMRTISSWLQGALVVDSGPYVGQLARAGVEAGVWSRPPTVPVVALVGTRSAATRRQVAHLLAHERGAMLVRCGRFGAPELAAARHAHVVALVADEQEEGIDVALASLCRAALALLEELPEIPAFIVSGGRTAAAFMSSVGAESIVARGQLLPLVALGTVRGGAVDGAAIATKGGLVGSDDTLREAVRLMRLFGRRE